MLCGYKDHVAKIEEKEQFRIEDDHVRKEKVWLHKTNSLVLCSHGLVFSNPFEIYNTPPLSIVIFDYRMSVTHKSILYLFWCPMGEFFKE